jgi:hypothetical protein
MLSDSYQKTETIMKQIILMLALVLAAAPGAFAQSNTGAGPQTPAQGAGMGHAGKSDPSDGATAAGANGTGGTLMQKRENGMSPGSASDAAEGKATGKITQ